MGGWVGGWVRWGYMRAGGAGAGLEEGVVVPKHDAMCGVRRARHPLVSAVVVRTECGEAEARAEKRSELERAPSGRPRQPTWPDLKGGGGRNNQGVCLAKLDPVPSTNGRH